MKKGFDRLRGIAAAGTIGVAGLLGGGSARAAVTAIPLNVTRGSAKWTSIDNSGCLDSVSVSTTGGFVQTFTANTCFGIWEGTLTGFGTDDNTDFYDQAMSLAVDTTAFANPDATVDLNLHTLTTDVVEIIPDVEAQIEYYFDPTRAVVRGLYTLTNISGAPITTSALVMGNYGSDADTTVQATEDGDLVVEDNDMWVVTDDNGTGDNDPIATVSTHGTNATSTNATVVPKTVITVGSPADTLLGGPASGDLDNYGYRYDVTIPAFGTVRILVFNEMTDFNLGIAAATAGAADFESLAAADAAGLLAGLTPQVQSEIVNYGAPPVVVAGGGGGGGGGGFALGVPGLLGALGSLLLLRRRDRKDRH